MKFERGKDPRSTMGIGLEKVLRKSVEKLLESGDILKDGVVSEEWKGRIEEEVGIKLEIYVTNADEWGPDVLIIKSQELGEMEFEIPLILFPRMQKVAAKTIGMDLIPTQPMSAPKGELFYLDYKYERNWWQRIYDKIRDIFRKKPAHLS